jgi:hypothetical protein
MKCPKYTTLKIRGPTLVFYTILNFFLSIVYYLKCMT